MTHEMAIYLCSLFFLAQCCLAPMNVNTGGDGSSRKDPVDEADPEQKKFQGKWNQVEMIIDGRQTNPDIVKQFQYRFEGPNFVNLRNDKTISEGTFTVDSSKKPAEMNLVEKAGVRLFAIYRFDNDKLTICFHEKTRPTDFESKNRQQRLRVVLQREKP